MLPCLHMLSTPGGSEGVTDGVENGETAAATDYQSPDMGVTHRLGPGKVSFDLPLTMKRVHQKGEGVHRSRPQSHRRFVCESRQYPMK